MKRVLSILVVIALAFSFSLTTSLAAKTDKNAKTSTTETKEVKKEETKKEEKTEKEEKHKVTLYLFRRSGCSHCAAEMQFLDTIINKYKNKVDIVIYNTSISENTELLQFVSEKLKKQVTGVPFNVIGTTVQEGYAEQLNDTFIEMLDKAYEDQVEDVVKKVIEEKKLTKVESTDLYEAMDEEGLEYTSKKSDKKSKDDIIVGIFFGGLAIFFGALIIISRKQTN